jgi:hypothetical protein
MDRYKILLDKNIQKENNTPKYPGIDVGSINSVESLASSNSSTVSDRMLRMSFQNSIIDIPAGYVTEINISQSADYPTRGHISMVFSYNLETHDNIMSFFQRFMENRNIF